MRLFTREVELLLVGQSAATQTHGDRDMSKDLIVKYFQPDGGATWYITEAEREGEDYRLFGYCDLGLGATCSELGYVMLSQLRNLRGVLGLPIERDLHYRKHREDVAGFMHATAPVDVEPALPSKPDADQHEDIIKGRRYCYYIIQSQDVSEHGGYVPSVIVEGESGHYPMSGNDEKAAWVWGVTLDAATECMELANEALGLKQSDVMAIVSSSMRAS